MAGLTALLEKKLSEPRILEFFIALLPTGAGTQGVLATNACEEASDSGAGATERGALPQALETMCRRAGHLTSSSCSPVCSNQ